MATSSEGRLRSLFEDYARAALSVLREANKQSGAVRITPVAEYEGSSMRSGYAMLLDSYRALRAVPDEKLERLPEAKAVARMLQDSRHHRRFYGSREQRVRRVVEYYVYHHETLNFYPLRFAEDLDEHLRMWSSHQTTIFFRAPVVGLGAGGASSTFGKNIRIVNFTDKQRSRFFKNLGDFSARRPEALLMTPYIVEVQRTVECSRFTGGLIDFREDRNPLKDSITAMRLAGLGWVGVLGVQECFLPSPNGYMFYSPHAPLNPAAELETSGIGGRYAPTRREMRNAREIMAALDTLRAAHTYRHVELGLHWFNQAFSTPRAEDKILAFVVALESTILRELRGDLTYRLKLRGLRLSGPPADRAQSTGFLLSAIYRCRSEISHQGVSLEDALGTVYRGKTPPSEKDFLEQTRVLVATLLARCIQEVAGGKTLDGLMSEIDRSIEIGAVSRPAFGKA